MKTDPLYLRLYRDLRAKMESGALSSGQRLPSLRQMALENGLGKITVLRAYEDLKAEGWLDSSERAGYFVRARISERATPKNPLRQPAAAVAVNADFQALVIEANRNAKLIPLGGSSLAPDLLPQGELKSCYARVIRRFPERVLGYETLGGMPELKREIVRRSALWGGTFKDSEIIITAGATEAIANAVRATTSPGDTVAVESPTYFGILTVLSLLGRKVLEIPTDPQTGIEVEHLAQVIKEKRAGAAILIPNFQNPTGSLIPDHAKQEIARLASRARFPIIECDTSSDLHLDGMRPKPIQCFSKDGYVLSIQSYSKIVAPGLRVASIAPGRFLDEVQTIKRGLSLASNSGAQLALAAFMREGGYERHLRRLRGRLRQTLPRVLETVRASFPESTRVARPEGGYLLWIQLPNGCRGRNLWAKALDKGISLTPGELFSSTKKYEDYIRLNCGLPFNDKTIAAIQLLGGLARKC